MCIGLASLGPHNHGSSCRKFALDGIHPGFLALKSGEELTVEDVHILVISEILFQSDYHAI